VGRIVVTEYISVDGVVDAPSGTEPFERVGWTDDFSRGPEGDKFKVEETMSSDALLLGRGTYDVFAPVWPHVEGEFADKFNSMPKYVVSSTLENPEWNNTQVLGGEVAEEVKKLTQQYERDIVVHGSPQLAQTLIERDLVDELQLMVYPVIVGAGKRLFTETTAKKNLRLVETKTSTTASTCASTGPPEPAYWSTGCPTSLGCSSIRCLPTRAAPTTCCPRKGRRPGSRSRTRRLSSTAWRSAPTGSRDQARRHLQRRPAI
jgi:dihydrofolate reductase